MEKVEELVEYMNKSDTKSLKNRRQTVFAIVNVFSNVHVFIVQVSSVEVIFIDFLGY